MEFEPLFSDDVVEDVEVLPEEHNETQMWFSPPEIELQIQVQEPIIPQEREFDQVFIYPQEDTFTSW